MMRVIQKRDREKGLPSIVVCCRTKFECDNFTNTCPDCGADYNWARQRLAPRAQWGEETGEHWADIVNADYSNALDEGADNY